MPGCDWLAGAAAPLPPANQRVVSFGWLSAGWCMLETVDKPASLHTTLDQDGPAHHICAQPTPHHDHVHLVPRRPAAPALIHFSLC